MIAKAKTRLPNQCAFIPCKRSCAIRPATIEGGWNQIKEKGADCSAPFGYRSEEFQEQPDVEPQVLHFMQVPLRTSV